MSVNADSRAMWDSEMDGDADGTITVNGGAPSFDDFEAMEESREDYKEAKAERSGLTNDKTPEKHQKAEKKAKKEVPSDERVAESDKKEEEDKNVDPSLAPNPDRAEVKMLKALNGEEEMQLPHDLNFAHKVDGEMENVSLQDLLNNYSGKVAWDKRFSGLDTERKQFKSERDELFNHLNEFQKYISEEKPMDAIGYLVDVVGGNRHNFHKALRETLLPDMEAYLEMSDEERVAHDAKQENEFLRQHVESLETRRKAELTRQETLAKEVEIRKAYGMNEDEFNTSTRELEELGVESDQMTPELVANYHQMKPIVQRAEGLVKQVDEGLVTNDELITEISQIIKDEPNIQDQEIVDMLVEATGTKKKIKVLNEKSSEPKVAKPAAVKDVPKEGIDLFSDLDEWY